MELRQPAQRQQNTVNETSDSALVWAGLEG